MLIMKVTYFLALLSLFSLPVLCKDYYEILGVAKDANNREIRQAFKKLALKLHPDKNKNDPEAHDKFVELNKVYETLKDGQKRNLYDLHGEEGLKDDFFEGGGSYHSWSYYYENFGIYDDDPEIITLSSSDFQQSVEGSQDLWFINYYSPACSHCHQLAPAWRAVAQELEGVIRIGAVNCEEDRLLCRQQQIHSYPSLVFYPDQTRYSGKHDKQHLLKFALSKLTSVVIKLLDKNFHHEVHDNPQYRNYPWFIVFCRKNKDCLSRETQLKLAAMMEGLVNIAAIDCDTDMKLCQKLGILSGAAYFEPQKVTSEGAKVISSLDRKEIAKNVYSFLPGATKLDKKAYQKMRSQLQVNKGPVWVIHFQSGHDKDSLELKKLPALLPQMRIGKVNCEKEPVICKEVHVHKYPTVIVFKLRGGYEMHHGRINAHDIANFARESASAVNIKILTPNEFPSVIEDGSPWFVDFYAPWCPPCMRLLPEFRKASKAVAGEVQFGTIDCTVHSNLCNKYHIESYPTTILFNRTQPHEFHGKNRFENLVEFVKDMMSPSVITLTETSFQKTVGKKTVKQIWIVDFFAPWCGPCQQLSPEWSKLGKMIADIPNMHIGQVDCTAEADLCNSQGVNTYPTIRLYPLGGKGTSQVSIYRGRKRDAESLLSWLFSFLPSTVYTLNSNTFEEQVLRDSSPWLVDFYAPWCGACQSFSPKYEVVAKKLQGKVKAGKVNCDSDHNLCQQAGVNAYPTLLFYKGTSSRTNKQPMKSTEVDTLGISDIIYFVERMLAGESVPQKDTMYDEESMYDDDSMFGGENIFGDEEYTETFWHDEF